MPPSDPHVCATQDAVTGESWELVAGFSWRKEIVRGAQIGLAIVAVLLLFQFFDSSFELIDDDAISSWQPIFTDFARQLSEGHMPVWSHHTSCGYPILGWPQPSYVYPPLWISHGICRLMGFDSGEFYVGTLMHFFLGAVASYVYLRRFGVHPLAATTGCLAATLSGILLGLGSSWPTYGFATAFWPLVFLTVEQIRTGRSLRFWTVFLGLLGGLAFLFTDLMLMVKFSLMAGLYFGLRLKSETFGRSLRAIAMSCVIALVIGAGQFVPSGELIASSPRMGMGSNDFYTAPPLLWLGFIFPFWQLPWEAVSFSQFRAAGGFFVGPCGLLGMLFAVRWYRPLYGPHRALLWIAGIYVGLALGDLWSPNDVIQRLPIFGSIRWPFRWMFEASCALALLSGFGLHLAFRDLNAGRGRGLVLSFVAAVGFLALMKWPSPPGLESLRAIMLIVWAIGLASLWRFGRPESPTAFLAVVAAWSAVALVANVPVAQQTRLAKMTRLLDHPLSVGRDTQDRVLFLARHAELVSAQKEGNLARSFPHQFNTRSVLGYVYRPPSQAWMDGFELDGLLYGNEPDIARRFLSERSTILSTLRVGSVVVFKNNKTLENACAVNPHLKLADETEFYKIYRNLGFKAPAFLVRDLRPEENRDSIVEMGTRLRMPEEALVDPAYSGPMHFSADGTVADFNEHHGQISFRVDAADDAFVIVTTTIFPRWRATIDGDEVPIMRVNGSFMGLRVPAGTHAVRLEYRPTDHLILLAISAAALFLTVVACSILFFRRPNSDTPS